jgi:hypothetical protein
MSRPMTEQESAEHKERCTVVRSIVSALRLTRIEDEDVQVALARLENWLGENDGRWTV